MRAASDRRGRPARLGLVGAGTLTAALGWARVRPLGPFFAAVLAAAVFTRYGVGIAGLIAAFTTGVLIVLSVIDFDSYRLPNRIVLPSAALVLAARLTSAPEYWKAWIGASLGAFACFLVLALVYPAGLGMGDVKLALLLGAALGGAVLPALLVGTLAAGVAGLVVLARQGLGARRRALPFGPFLAFGAITILLLMTP
jgi:leader peptidase (prepilin peptidase) / N-methyltransferase